MTTASTSSSSSAAPCSCECGLGRATRGALGECHTELVGGRGRYRRGRGPAGPALGAAQRPSASLLVFLRLIREQLLEGDFTVNMRLLQVLGSAVACSGWARRQTLTQRPPCASRCDRLGQEQGSVAGFKSLVP